MTPAIAAMSLWEHVECNNNICISLPFLEDVSEALRILKIRKLTGFEDILSKKCKIMAWQLNGIHFAS